jgi:hypothetical protein
MLKFYFFFTVSMWVSACVLVRARGWKVLLYTSCSFVLDGVGLISGEVTQEFV